MQYTKLHIEYADLTHSINSLVVDFRLRDCSFTNRWIERVEAAKQTYKIDSPNRFYGFGTLEQQQKDALHEINHCINVINFHQKLIDRGIIDVHDQDTLNYLHSIFEIHHGLLDQQNDTSPLRYALADLNVLVHKCESVARGAHPRHVVTWYGLPKDHYLADSDYELFTDEWSFGTVMLNYVEIGKTLEDLANDNDDYIGEDAFRPFNHYSADFSVKYWTTDHSEINEKRAKIQAYHKQHQDRFGPWSPKFAPGSIPLADIITPITLADLEPRQYVKSINFS